MENKKTMKKFEFGLLVALGCFLIQAIPFGVASNIHPQFLGYIIEKEGFALGAISAMFTIGTIISAVFSPVIGKLFAKLPAKLIYTVGAVVSASGIFLLSVAGQRLPLFYLGYGIAQVGAAAISSIGIPVLATSWFDDSVKGKALGIIFAGSGLGNIFLQKLSASWITTIGYQAAYQKFALLSVAVGVVVSLLLIRMPKDKSEVMGRKESSEVENKENEVEELKGYTFAEAKNLKAYWIFAIGFVFIGIYVSGLATQFLAYLKFEKFDAETLGTVGAVFAACSLVGNLMGGTLYDKLGSFKTTLVGFVLAATACLSIMFAPQLPALAFAFAVAKGLSVFAYILAPSMLTGALFGKKDFGTVLGITQVFFALGFALGSAIFGVIVDTVNYTAAWSCMLVAIFVAYTMLLSAIKSMNKLNKENDK